MLRKEFAKIITGLFNAYNPLATSTFTDCPVGAWYTTYVGSLQNEGLANGMGDGTYGAGLNISRQDAATMFSRALVKYQAVALQMMQQQQKSYHHLQMQRQ